MVDRSDPTLADGLIVPLVSGFVAILAIGIGAVLAGSPFDTHLPGAWFFGMAHYSAGLRIVGKVGVFVGLAVLLVAWYRIVVYVRRNSSTPVRTVLAIFATWVLPLLVAPPLFSQDAYSYVAQGTMVVRSINPYHYGPEVLSSSDPKVASLVAPIWDQTAVPYGPLFLGLEAGAVDLSGHHETLAIEELRLLTIGGVLLAVSVLPVLCRRWGTHPALAAALVILNPLTLLGLISPAHNDTVVAGLILGGLALLQRHRPGWAVVLCALAAAVKAPALIATAFVCWQWAGQSRSWRLRSRVVAAVTGITVAVFESLALTTRLGWGWLATMGTPGLVHSVLSPSTDVALLGEGVVHLLRHGPATAALLGVSRVLFGLGAAGLIAWLVWKSRQIGLVLAVALALLAVVALGPIFQPWYLVWGLFCLAPVATGRWQVLFFGVTVYGAVATLPRFEPLVSSLGWAGAVFGIVSLAALACLCLPRISVKKSIAGRSLSLSEPRPM